MFSTASQMVQPDLTVREAISGILANISLATWLSILIPQLLLNYRLGNADSVSLLFLFLWVLGDACNLIGAIMAGLLPVCIIMATYYVMQDWVIFGQCVYYKLLTKNETSAEERSSTSQSRTATGEHQPLLSAKRSQDQRGSVSAPVIRRAASAASVNLDGLKQILIDHDKARWNPILENAFWLGAIMMAGVVSWVGMWISGLWVPTPLDADMDTVPDVVQTAEILGYISATCYCVSRYPQIYKNWRHKSCQGLSLLFFLLSTLGNSTYGFSLLVHSLEPSYLRRSLPWIVGSLGTLVADAIIFIQFMLYRSRGSDKTVEEGVRGE